MEIYLIFAFKFSSYSAINPTNVQPPSLVSDLKPAPPHIQVQSYLVSKTQQTYIKTIHTAV